MQPSSEMTVPPRTSLDEGAPVASAADRMTRRWRRHAGWLSLLLTMLAAVSFALVIGEDGNGDQRAFHVYNVWLLLHPHQDPAGGVGGLGGLVPSAWNLPWYFLALKTPAWVAVAYLGALHGLTVWLSGAITWSAARNASTSWRLLLTVVVTFISCVAPATLTEFATTFGNLTTATLVLAAVLLYLRRGEGGLRGWRAWWIGLLAGAAFGLKWTNAVAVIALVAAVLVCEPLGRRMIRRSLGMIAGLTAGALLTGGYWAFLMWRRFGNPLFPFYNNLFSSEYGPTNNFHDERFSPHFPEALGMPFRMLYVAGYPSEWHGRDARWALIVGLALGTLIAHVVRRRSEFAKQLPQSRLVRAIDRRFVFTFTAVGWAVWLVQFSIARYLIVLELMSGLAMLVLIDCLVQRTPRKLLALTLAGTVVLAYFIVPGWTRRAPSGSWYAYEVPAMAKQHNLLVLFPETVMYDFVLPALPGDVQAARVPKAFGDHYPGLVWGAGKEDFEIAQEIDEHHGPIISITSWEGLPRVEAIASAYGLKMQSDECDHLRTKFGDAAVCPWTRQ